jgi:hypothetical protein
LLAFDSWPYRRHLCKHVAILQPFLQPISIQIAVFR